MWGTKIKDLPFKLVVQSEIEIWRAADFWTKEPETIAWIDSFAPGSVFWDIGANIGVFSLYAMMRDVVVHPFDPDGKNFIRLLENLSIQSEWYPQKEIKTEMWRPYRCAISDFDGKSTFYVPHAGAGRSGGQIGAAVDDSGREFKPVESYEVETYKIDTLADKFGVPNHIKIDVDGIEWRILQGGSATLASQYVKSVLVEVNHNHGEIEKFMTDRGFTSFNRFNGPDLNRRINQKQYNKIYTRA